jgi:hypothetical protein
MRRWLERYIEEGYNGLLDRRRDKPSRRGVPLAMVEKVFALYREKHFDLNVGGRDSLRQRLRSRI